MARRKFLNTDDVGAQSLSTYGSNTWYFFQDFVSQYKGIITHLKLWTGAGATRYGFYRSDDSYTCLENTAQTTVAGTTEIAINTPFSVDLSEVIQVALQATVSNSLKYYADSSNPWEYYYATTLPETIGANYGTENRTEAMETWGYPQPEVTSVNGGSDISDSDTAVPIVGTDFVDYDFSSVNPKVYLCPTSTFGSEVEQTVTNIADTGLEITVDGTGLTPGTVYLFVETGLNQFSEPITVTLAGGATIPNGGSPSFEIGSISFSANGLAVIDSASPTFEIGSISFAASGTLVIESDSPTFEISGIGFSADGLTVIESAQPSFEIGDISFAANGFLIPDSESPSFEIGSIDFVASGYVVPEYPTAVSPVFEIGDIDFSASGLAVITSESPSFDIGDISFSADGLLIPIAESSVFEIGDISFQASGFVVDNMPRSESPVFEVGLIEFSADGYLIPQSNSFTIDIGGISFYATGSLFSDYVTKYERQIALAQASIAKKGKVVTWIQIVETTPDPSKPWEKTQVRNEYSVPIVFFPFNLQTKKMFQMMTGMEVTEGNFYGLMANVPFEPKRKDKVLYKTDDVISLVNFNSLEPDGTPILYTLEFQR